MSGSGRFEQKRKSTKVKQDSFPFFLVFGLVALGIVITLLLAHFGWALIE